MMMFLKRRGEKLMKSSSGDIVDVFMYTDAEHTASVRVCVVKEIIHTETRRIQNEIVFLCLNIYRH